MGPPKGGTPNQRLRKPRRPFPCLSLPTSLTNSHNLSWSLLGAETPAGWPVYSKTQIAPLLFVFRRRGGWTVFVRKSCLDAGNLLGVRLANAAPPKNKKKDLGASVTINRPPRWGFKPPERWSQGGGQRRYALVSVKKLLCRCG